MDTADMVINIVSGIALAALIGGVIFGIIWAVIYTKKIKEKSQRSTILSIIIPKSSGVIPPITIGEIRPVTPIIRSIL